MRGSRNFWSGLGGGGGVQASQLILQSKEGSNGFITHFPGGSNFFQGWGLIETHITITCDFPGRSGPPIPPLDPHMDIVARIGSDEPVRPPFKLRNFKC